MNADVFHDDLFFCWKEWEDVTGGVFELEQVVVEVSSAAIVFNGARWSWWWYSKCIWLVVSTCRALGRTRV